MQGKFQQLKCDVDASLESSRLRPQSEQVPLKKTERKSKDDGDIVVKEPILTFASGFNAADRQSLRDSGPLSIERDHIKYEQTIDELKGKITEL